MALSWLRSIEPNSVSVMPPAFLPTPRRRWNLPCTTSALRLNFQAFGGTSQISELWTSMLGRTARTYFRLQHGHRGHCDFGIGCCRSCVGIEIEIPHLSGNPSSSFTSRPRPAGSIQIMPSNLTFLHRPESIHARSQGEMKVKSKGLL